VYSGVQLPRNFAGRLDCVSGHHLPSFLRVCLVPRKGVKKVL
jgi:hypothetical protein